MINMWRAEHLIDAICFRAMSKLAAVHDQEGREFEALIIKDSSAAPEGHKGSGNLNPRHIIGEFLKSRPLADIVEIRDMGIAAVVDLTEQSILAQNLATCYCMVFVCKVTKKASLCHIPDSFAERLTTSATWGKAAFDHLVATLCARVTDGVYATTHALVIGGQKADTIERNYGLKMYLIAFFTWALPPEMRDDSLSMETDVNRIVQQLRPYVRGAGTIGFEAWSERVAHINFEPLLLNPAMWEAAIKLVHEGISGITDFQSGWQWAMAHYPLKQDGVWTPVGEFVMREGGQEMANKIRDLANAGSVLRGWLKGFESRNVQLEEHVHLNEREPDAHATSVAVGILNEQPIVYIWTVPEETRTTIDVIVNRETKWFRLHNKGSIELPGTQLVTFGDDLMEVMSKLKHMGVFLYDDEVGGKLRLVTTRQQYDECLKYLGYDDEQRQRLPLSHLYTLDRTVPDPNPDHRVGDYLGRPIVAIPADDG